MLVMSASARFSRKRRFVVFGNGIQELAESVGAAPEATATHGDAKAVPGDAMGFQPSE